jgi:hypothetical protein
MKRLRHPLRHLVFLRVFLPNRRGALCLPIHKSRFINTRRSAAIANPIPPEKEDAFAQQILQRLSPLEEEKAVD